MQELRTLISENAIQARIKELGQAIRLDYQDSSITCICVLRGALFFAADLLRNIGGDVRIEFILLSSHNHHEPLSSEVLYFSGQIEGEHCVVIEDIVETGHTLELLVDYLDQFSPKTLRSVSLLDKPSNRDLRIRPDYIGFSIPFVMARRCSAPCHRRARRRQVPGGRKENQKL